MSEFDDIIKQKANSHESPVPPGAWDNINKKKRKRRFIIWWMLAALIITGVGTPAYLHLKNDKEDKQLAVKQPSNNEALLNQQEKNAATEITGTDKNKSTENISSSVI
jgi:hypothetical protein